MSAKKAIPLIISAIVAFSAVSVSSACKTNEASELAAGSELRVLDGIEFDYDNMFFDDFSGGVDYDSWYIGKQAWGSSGDGNGGVIPENVNYTDDGVLVLSGNGDYYTAGDVRGVGSRKDGTLTGAAIISKFLTAPGRYEAKMKVLPRQGACTAMWTYAYDTATSGNHEIDIELPGGTKSGVITFENVLNTNYITLDGNQSQDVNLNEATNGNTIVLNDGKWHTFGFDWYTCEQGEDPALQGEDVTLGKVVYYVDGIVTAVSDLFVPYYQTRLWLGVWFPNNPGFMGSADFESDCMYVDWVKYTPFKNQPFVEFTPPLGTSQVADEREYPSAPVSTASVNKVSNGNFEYAAKGKTNSGWRIDRRVIDNKDLAAMRAQIVAEHPEYTAEQITEAVNEMRKEIQALPANEQCIVAEGIGYLDSCGLKVEKRGLINQTIDSVYEGFETELSLLVKGKGTVSLLFMGYGDDVVEEKTVEVDAENWEETVRSFTAPAGTKKIRIQFYTELTETLFADDVNIRIK
ncbi:MAG: family 16 glycosylhydrolase [Clostridia bacterium]|nr:family 16 glycosylhydrolase [Clostridia bacterium]